jgi:hypothetical protein
MTSYRVGITSLRSRTTHVVPSIDAEYADSVYPREAKIRAYCGAVVDVRQMTVTESSEVCMKCRKAAGWPMVTSFIAHGWKFTDNWVTKAQTSERIEN